MKKQIFMGVIVKEETKNGKTIFKGKIGGVPIVGFQGKTEDGKPSINLIIDAGFVAWYTNLDADENNKGDGKGGGYQKKPYSAPARQSPSPAPAPRGRPVANRPAVKDVVKEVVHEELPPEGNDEGSNEEDII